MLLACAGLCACSGDDDAAASGRDAATNDLQAGDAGLGASGNPNRICTATDDCEELVALDPAAHVSGGINYADPPPAGGPHNSCWGEYGVHDTPLADERWVHNLEHGAVVYLYRCPDGCDAEVQDLADLASSRPLALVTEYLDLPTRFGAVAWGVRLLTDAFDQDAFEAFYAAHSDHAPESIGSGPPSSCL